MHLSLDLRHNLRSLRRNLGFALLCTLVIAMGIAVSVTMYTLVANAVYKPMPFPDGDRYVAMRTVARDTGLEQQGATVDSFTFQQVESALRGYEAFGSWRDSFITFSDGEVAEQYFASYIDPGLMQIAAVAPVLGRGLLPSDDLPGAEPVVVLSYHVWQNYYAGRTDIVGHSSRIDGELHTIVGVMPEGFVYPVSGEVWLPSQLPANAQPGDQPLVWVMGVLGDSLDRGTAERELNAALLELGERYPEYYSELGAKLIPFTRFPAPAMTYWHTLTGLAIALLLLVSLNVANLLVVRCNERIQELAIRNALGASPWRLVRSLLLDSSLICGLGLLAGIVLADLGMASIGAMMNGIYQDVTQTLPPSWSSAYAWEVGTVVTTFLAIGLVWLFSSALAVWKVLRNDISFLLGGGNTGSISAGSSAGTATLVAFEIVFSCFLLIFCATLVGAANDMKNIDYGTATEGYLTGRIALPTAGYSEVSAREAYRRELRTALLQSEGIDEVVFASSLPSQQGIPVAYNLEDRDVLSDTGAYPTQEVIYVGPDYFATLDVLLPEGREFDAGDSASSLPVVIVNEKFAQQMWPDESALGKRIQVNSGASNAQWLTVVGVSSHIIQRWSFFGTDVPVLYRPLAQASSNASAVPQAGLSQSEGEVFHAVLKVGAADPDSYRRRLQEAATGVDRDIPVTFLFPLGELLELTNAMSTISTTISSNIALFTLVLAVTGIYAVVARSVNQQTREIGIRRALGSSDGKVLWVFIGQGLKYLLLGLLLGGGAAILLSNAMTVIFATMANWVPAAFIGVSLGLGLLIVFAAYHPARKLVAMEPGDALHYE